MAPVKPFADYPSLIGTNDPHVGPQRDHLSQHLRAGVDGEWTCGRCHRRLELLPDATLTRHLGAMPEPVGATVLAHPPGKDCSVWGFVLDWPQPE